MAPPKLYAEQRRQELKTKQLTQKQQSSVACPTCHVVAGKRCVLVAGGPRNEPHKDRKLLAAEVMDKKKN